MFSIYVSFTFKPVIICYDIFVIIYLQLLSKLVFDNSLTLLEARFKSASHQSPLRWWPMKYSYNGVIREPGKIESGKLLINGLMWRVPDKILPPILLGVAWSGARTVSLLELDDPFSVHTPFQKLSYYSLRNEIFHSQLLHGTLKCRLCSP